MKWLAAGVLGLLLAGAVVVWRRRRTWTISREDFLPRARPYIHRAIGSRIHVPERGR